MKPNHRIVIAGAGGIAAAAGLILTEWSEAAPSIYIGNHTLHKAENLVEWIRRGTEKKCPVHAFHLNLDQPDDVMKTVLDEGDIILDCLPGSLAPRIAGLAIKHKLHYVNLTEYVAETEEIKKLAHDAGTGFVLQSGLAPGYIGIVANGLLQNFCKEYEVERVERVEMKVGALSDHAVAPHYYGFTWSPVGVATEYLKEALVIRDYQKTMVPSLSATHPIVINGITYETDLTSGGAADFPDALEGKVQHLDYQTLRHPGHYQWIKSQIEKIGDDPHPVEALQERMEAVIPHLEDDQIILYAAVQGRDHQGVLRRKEIAKKILPQQVGKHRLRAIQTTTAVPMLQAAEFLLNTKPRGIILQSQLDPNEFLNGKFIMDIYGDAAI